MTSPSQELLREILDYSPESGLFVWKKEATHGKSIVGKLAGTKSRRNGYVLIGVRGFGQIGAHRLAWIYVHGLIPAGMEIDHRDVCPWNNAIGNLRLATSSEQKMNKRVQSNSKSGLKGAYFHACRPGKKWRSQIKVDGRIIFLGYFRTAEEAHVAYGRASLQYYGQFARAA